MLQICSDGEWVAVCDDRWYHIQSFYSSLQRTWSTLGFVGTYYCNNQSDSLFSCLTNNTSYLNNDRYCNNNQDTVSLQCNVSNGESLL